MMLLHKNRDKQSYMHRVIYQLITANLVLLLSVKKAAQNGFNQSLSDRLVILDIHPVRILSTNFDLINLNQVTYLFKAE